MALTITITPRNEHTPAGKRAEAELHVTGGELDGVTLVGFSIYEGHAIKRHVTFPARPYSVSLEPRGCSVLQGEDRALTRIRELVFKAYDEHERNTATRVAAGAAASAR